MTAEYDFVSLDAQAALTEYVAEFETALVGKVTPWAIQLGRYRRSDVLRTVWPVPITAAKYEKLKGDMRYRKLAEKSLDLKLELWQDGVEELASVIEAPDFIGWDKEADAMAEAALALPNTIIANLLEAGTTTAGWDDQFFFDTDHPTNFFQPGLGTFSNYVTNKPLNLANLLDAKARFRKVQTAAGRSMGLELTHILVPNALAETAFDLRNQGLIVSGGAAIDNRHKGSFEVVVAPELTDETDWYGICSKPGISPWIVQEGKTETLVHDKSSHLYKTTLKVAMSSVKRAAGALALPHCIIKFKGEA